jgi:small subunit ribosomal protein S7
MRRKVKNRNIPAPDAKFRSFRVSKLINKVMWDGHKETARRIVYKAFDLIKDTIKEDEPIEIFEAALKNSGPTVEVRSRRVGGANYQVPREVRPERRQALAIRWIVDAARSKKGQPMHKKLADEIMLAAKGEGSAVKKKDDTHKMAEANKAFAHFSW